MSQSSDDKPIGDERLVQYLLGAVSDEEAERLDELSVADDEIAWRLRALESDLVDAFVRGELTDAIADQVRRAYVESPHRKRKVEFATLLLAYEKADGRTVSTINPAAPGLTTVDSTRVRSTPRSLFHWAPVAAALVAAIVAGSFLVENQRLRQQIARAQAEHATLEQTSSDLRAQLERERSTSARIRDEQPHRSAAPSAQEPIGPFVLLPMRRGTGDLTTVTVSRGAERILFQLRLESDDSPGYQATLRDSANGRVVWRSGRVDASSNGSVRFVTVLMPAAVVKPQAYTFELTGRSAPAPAAFVTSYAFRVVLE
jgi:hypothetical protein